MVVSIFFFYMCITISWTLDMRGGNSLELSLTSSFLTLAHRQMTVPGTVVGKPRREADLRVG